MIFNEASLDELRKRLGGLLSERRFAHTLGVERVAMRLARVFMPEREYELRASALLHDVTKELGYDEHFKLIEESGISLSDEDKATANALHSFSAVGYIKKHFPEFATPDVLDGVFNHTLGDEGMSLFSSIIFISDYIEDGRRHEACKRVADYLYSELRARQGYDEKLKALYEACVMSIDYTVRSLKARGIPINSRTLMTKNVFRALI